MKKLSPRYIRGRVRAFLRNPFFWILTLGGNSIILIGATLLYIFESDAQLNLGFFDCVLWSTGIITTVGYGGFTAATLPGKISIFVLMLTGSLFIWSYMGFLVTGLMSPELNLLEKDMHEVEKEIRDLKGGSF